MRLASRHSTTRAPCSGVGCRAAEPKYLETGAKLRHIRLTGGHAERQMEALLIVIPPSFVAPTTAREGEGFYYVLEGNLTVTLGKDTFTLRPGDSAHFDQLHLFQMSTAGKRVVRIQCAGTPATLRLPD